MCWITREAQSSFGGPFLRDSSSCFPTPSLEGVGDFPKLVGRTLDLTSAYKQFGVSSSDREWLRILVQDFDQGRTTCMGVNALPFGAVGSVQGFLRAAISIWTIGLRVLSLCWSSYFDDYPCLSRIELARSTEYAMTSLFKLLGVQYAAEGKKATEFTGIFKMLGLQVDLATSSPEPAAAWTHR